MSYFIERTYVFISYIHGVVMFETKDPLKSLGDVGLKYDDWSHCGVDISLVVDEVGATHKGLGACRGG